MVDLLLNNSMALSYLEYPNNITSKLVGIRDVSITVG